MPLFNFIILEFSGPELRGTWQKPTLFFRAKASENPRIAENSPELLRIAYELRSELPSAMIRMKAAQGYAVPCDARMAF